ncbi:hypothetical protein D3C72_1462590 [compost metagenome]
MVLDVGQGGAIHRCHHLGLPANGGQDAVGLALVRDVGHRNAQGVGHELDSQVGGVAQAGGREVQLAGCRLGFFCQILERLDARGRVGRQHERHRRQHGHANKILLGVVGQWLVGELIEHHQRHAAQQQGVAIGGRIQRVLCGNEAARTGLVLHHDGGANGLACVFGPHACDGVAAAARGLRHDQAHGTTGVGGLREHGGGRGGCDRDTHQDLVDVRDCFGHRDSSEGLSWKMK